jgi:hypothetical protein
MNPEPSTPAPNRRSEPRTPMGGAFANKYIDGMPHLVELLDASANGVLLRRIHEPELAERDTFALEMCVDEFRFFAWARRVRKDDDKEAFQILAADPLDRARFQKSLRTRNAP